MSGQQQIRDLQALVERLQKQLNGIKSAYQCVICTELYCLPFAVKCGHSFCYDCLLQWINAQPKHSRASCPTCRTEIVQEPIKDLSLQQQVDQFIQHADPVEQNQFQKRVIRSQRQYERDQTAISDNSNQQSVWKLLFPQSKFDDDDGVARCYRCMWEIVSDRCVNCGAEFSETRSTGQMSVTSTTTDQEQEDDFEPFTFEPDNQDQYLDTDDSFSTASDVPSDDIRRNTTKRSKLVDSEASCSEEECSDNRNETVSDQDNLQTSRSSDEEGVIMCTAQKKKFKPAILLSSDDSDGNDYN